MKNFASRSGAGPTKGVLHPKSDRRSANFQRGLLVGVLAVALLGVPSIGFAGSKASETSRESGLGAAAAISSLVYAPVKLVYAVGGLVVGGCAWIFTAGDTEVAEKVFTRSLRGTYVITPGILLGEEKLEFIGRDLPDEVEPTAAVASADTSSGVVYDDSGYDEMGW